MGVMELDEVLRQELGINWKEKYCEEIANQRENTKSITRKKMFVCPEIYLTQFQLPNLKG